MSTEYTFDGLDEWEKNLAQVIDQQYHCGADTWKSKRTDSGSDWTFAECLELGNYRKTGRHLLY